MRRMMCIAPPKKRDPDVPILESLKPFFDGMIATSGQRDERPTHEARESLHALIETSFNALAHSPDPMPLERDYKIAVTDGSIKVRQYSALFAALQIAGEHRNGGSAAEGQP